MTHVLVVEDDRAIQEMLQFWLAQSGYRVSQALSAEAGLEQIKHELPDVILLDWMLPRMSGLAMARQLRADRRTRSLPLIMVTAKGDEPDLLAGLEHGADDYIAKPFSPKELLARMKAVLRRRKPEEAGDPLQVGAIVLDPVSYRVTIGDHKIELGPTEFKLLYTLALDRGRVVTRDELLQKVWGRRETHRDRTVDVFVRRLRQKIDRQSTTHSFIQTRFGVGYKLEPEPK